MNDVTESDSSSILSFDVEKKTCLSTDFVPGIQDVIIGRGKKIFQHKGNERLRNMVSSALQDYSAAVTKTDKSSIILSIVNQIRFFIKYDVDTGLWCDAGDFLAREKVSQTFRDSLHSNYRSSNEFKKKRRREINASSRKARVKTSHNKRMRKNNDVSGLLSATTSTEQPKIWNVIEEELVRDCENDTYEGSIPDSFFSTQWFEEQGGDPFEPNPIPEKKASVEYQLLGIGNFEAFFHSNNKLSDEIDQGGNRALLKTSYDHALYRRQLAAYSA